MGADAAADVATQLEGLAIDGAQQRPGSRAAPVAGMEPVLEALRELIGAAICSRIRLAAVSRFVAPGSLTNAALPRDAGWPVLWAAEGEALGVTWPRGLLLHGPPGTGKTAAVQARAHALLPDMPHCGAQYNQQTIYVRS